MVGHVRAAIQKHPVAVHLKADWLAVVLGDARLGGKAAVFALEIVFQDRCIGKDAVCKAFPADGNIHLVFIAVAGHDGLFVDEVHGTRVKAGALLDFGIGRRFFGHRLHLQGEGAGCKPCGTRLHGHLARLVAGLDIDRCNAGFRVDRVGADALIPIAGNRSVLRRAEPDLVPCFRAEVPVLVQYVCIDADHIGPIRHKIDAIVIGYQLDLRRFARGGHFLGGDFLAVFVIPHRL